MKQSNFDLFHQLQTDATDSTIPVTDLVRRAKILATRLEQKNELVWINRELNGYMDLSWERLPTYRHLKVEIRAYNPFYKAWVPVFLKSEMHEIYSGIPIKEKICDIEISLGKKENSYPYSYPIEKAERLIELLGLPLQPALFVSYESLYGIVYVLRDLIFNWCLELEELGIIQDLKEKETKQMSSSTNITNNVQNQHVNFMGTITENSSVTNNQNLLNVESIGQFRDSLNKTREKLSEMPKETAEKLKPLLNDGMEELKCPSPNLSILRGIATSMRNIFEGIASNVTAQTLLKTLPLF